MGSVKGAIWIEGFVAVREHVPVQKGSRLYIYIYTYIHTHTICLRGSAEFCLGPLGLRGPGI